MRIRGAFQHLFRLAFLLALLLLAGCAAPAVTWVSRPPLSRIESAQVDVRFEPVKEGVTYFNVFRLTVVNRSAEPVTVDWNRTRYLYGGANAGAFAFKGIAPEQIKAGTVPPDVIAPAAQLTKIIAPVRLIAFAPMGAKGVGIATEGIRAGTIPEGEHGIALALSFSGGTVLEKLSVRIEAVPAAPAP
ncbi:MAG: hypothetical protein PVG78_01065 [Desulfobacterales bacterium]|jgi:hypothetical protein